MGKKMKIKGKRDRKLSPLESDSPEPAAESGLNTFYSYGHCNFFPSAFSTTLLFTSQINLQWVFVTNKSISIRNPLKVIWKENGSAVLRLEKKMTKKI